MRSIDSSTGSGHEMSSSAAFTEIGYRVEDGDIGYLGDTHLSFAERPAPSAAHIRTTPTGSAACAALVDLMHDRFPAAHASRAERQVVTPERYWAAISRVARGF
ncbi:hypothetical protein [Burkholderia ubonensis]|uniref:hypothetical protein n=1 Tax=Burkholderia ubonensis TaxID=101571 RepID=UPI0012FCC974|nr:hypothetical protein [Burkholderia ubonensis]